MLLLQAGTVRWSDEVEQGAWIDERLDDFTLNSVTSHVPRGFPAYARVLHPLRAPWSSEGGPVRWWQVSAWSGIALRPGTRFREIGLPPHWPAAPPPWDLYGPVEGSLEQQDAQALVDILEDHTPRGGVCWFAVWDGWAELHGTVPASVENGPRLWAPASYRSHLLATGVLVDALALMHDRAGLGDTAELTPALWWPHDRSWCVATDVDDDVTYVAGPTELIDHLHRDPRLETQTAAEGEPELLDLPKDWLAELLVPAARGLLTDGEAEVVTVLGSLLCLLHAEPEKPGVLEIGVVGHARWSDQPTRVPLAEQGEAAVAAIVTALRRALRALLH